MSVIYRCLFYRVNFVHCSQADTSRTHAHARTHTHEHTRTHTHTHARTLTNTHARTHAHTHARTHARTTGARMRRSCRKQSGCCAELGEWSRVLGPMDRIGWWGFGLVGAHYHSFLSLEYWTTWYVLLCTRVLVSMIICMYARSSPFN